MKRYIYSLVTLFAVVSISSAQSHVDALRYSQHSIGGTARSVAMGGAFGALGGDFSSLSHNPAGLGVYRKSEFTFTPELYFDKTTTRYYGNSVDENKFNFNLSNLGYVAVFDDGGGAISSVNFGIGYNRLANFNRNSVINADNPYTSYSDFMAADANKYGFNDNYSFFTSAMFWDAGAIYNANTVDSTLSPDLYWINDDYLISDSIFRTTEQLVTKNEKGKINEWAISLGFNVSDILYIGGTFGIQPVYYSYEKKFKEYRAGDKSFNYFNYNEELKVRGTGYTAKIGAIIRPVPMLRLGAAFHLPVTYLLKEEFNTNMTSRWANGTLYPKDNDGYLVDELKSEYKVTTPFKAIGSVGVTFGKMLILSSDIEYIDYSTMRMEGQGFDLSGENEAIREVYNNNINLKTGAELRLGKVYFRGGFGYYGSPYAQAEENVDAFRLSYSGGIGIRDNNMFLDIAYQYTNYDERTFLYGATDGNGVWRENAVNIDSKVSRIMTTVGFKF